MSNDKALGMRKDLALQFVGIYDSLRAGMRFAKLIPHNAPRAEVSFDNSTRETVFEWDGMNLGVKYDGYIIYVIYGETGHTTLSDALPPEVAEWLRLNPNASG